MTYLLLLFSLLAHKPDYCSCNSLGPINDKQYNEYNLILKGEVTKVLLSTFERTVYLKVEAYYKGRERQANIKITTPLQEGMCGIIPKVGEEWLIFAYTEGKSYSTDLCTRTKNMNPKSWNYNRNEIAEDLKFLEAKLKSNSR